MSDQQPVDIVYDRLRATWDAGDYEGLIQQFRSQPEEFVARLPVAPPGRVIDIGCGTGALALPLARRGFSVTGLDPSPNMLGIARVKARAQGVGLRLDEGIVEAMPYPDSSFDVAVSMFAIMFASAPKRAVCEVARVLKPDGLLAMANWTRAGFSMRMSAAFLPHIPPQPADSLPPIDWGDADQIRGLLSPHFDRVETSIMPIVWHLPLAPAEAADMFLEKGGPPQMMLRSMSADKRAKLVSTFRQIWIDNNISSDPKETVIHNEYLTVHAWRA